MQLSNRRDWTWAGLVAFLWFSACVLLLAALRPDYQHAHKAISELGAIGAPYMLAMNIFGFIGTGVLLGLFAMGYRANLGENAAGYKTLLLTAIIFAMTAVPITMNAQADPDRTSVLTITHFVFVMLVPLPWLWAMSGIFRRYRKGSHRSLAMMSIFAFILLVAITLYRMLGPDTQVPGLWQRASFAVFLAWYAGAAILLRKKVAVS